MRQTALIGATVLVAIGFLVWALQAPAPVAGDRAAQPAPASQANASTANLSGTAAEVDPAIDPRLLQIAEAVRSKYADRIDQADWQIKVLTHLLNLLQELYPDAWQDAMATVLQLAFPDQADALLERLAAWLDYQLWIEEVYSAMAFANADERHETLWAKRRALFGDDAEIIWGAELKQRAFTEAVAAIDQQSGSITQKSDAYVALVRETWGDSAFGNQGRNTTQLMQAFVKLESVQEELRTLPAAEQDRLLTDFRRDMGLDDEALARWSELDEERRDQWGRGDEYMRQRQLLVDSLEGEARQAAIRDLQIELFGPDEARFIRNEEASGVFRFEQEQVIGLN